MAKCTGKVPLKQDGRIRRDDNGKPVTRPCRRDAITGGKVCPQHGGRAPQVKAKAAVRAEVMRMGLDDIKVDPGETLLAMIKQSRTRAELLAAQLEKAVEAHGGDLVAVMVGDTLVVDREGNTVKVGEYVRGLYAEEARERDRCANMCVKGIAAGLAERQVRMAEKQGELIAKVLMAVFDELQLTEEQREAAPDVIRRQLRLIS